MKRRDKSGKEANKPTGEKLIHSQKGEDENVIE